MILLREFLCHIQLDEDDKVRFYNDDKILHDGYYDKKEIELLLGNYSIDYMFYNTTLEYYIFNIY